MRLSLIVLALLALASCARQPAGNEIAASFHAEEVRPDFEANLADRPVFPFSVVPGGTHSAKEAKSKAAADPVVRQHYAGVDFSRLKPFRLTQPASGYVSFRVGNRIFWTSQRIYLKPGEMILSDGAKLLRARCGNQISLSPQLPVLAGPSPNQALLETPIWDIPEYEALAADLFRRAGEIPLFTLPGNLPPSSLEPLASLPPQAYSVAPPPNLIAGPFPGPLPHPRDPGSIDLSSVYFFPWPIQTPVLEVPGFIVTPWLPLLPPTSRLPLETADFPPISLASPVLIASGIPFLPGVPGGNLPVNIPPEWRIPIFPTSPGTPPLAVDPPVITPPGESNPPPTPPGPQPPPQPDSETEPPPVFEPIPEPGTIWLVLAAALGFLWARARP